MPTSKNSKETVSELAHEVRQREAELAIINSVQAALAAQKDIHGIFEAVGEKLREVFSYQDVSIYSADLNALIMTVEYSFEKGRKFERVSVPMNSLYEYLMAANKTFVFNGDLPEFATQFKDYKVPGGELPRSAVAVPVPRRREVDPPVYLTLQDVGGKRFFSDSDVRLLETLASSMSVALENARLFAETQQRNAELAIINSVQEGLASKLDMQEIYELVGNKIHEIFHNTDLSILMHDLTTNLLHIHYAFEYGKRWTHEPIPLPEYGFLAHVLRSGRTLVINENVAQAFGEFGGQILSSPVEGSGARGPYTLKVGDLIVPDMYIEKSSVHVPLMVGDRACGVITLLDMEREHAFSESDVRLLETLANSMSVALENARLFDQTQHLLNETEQRAAELGIISSVQNGLASQLDIQAIFDLVGEKISGIFKADGAGIFTYDRETNLEHFPYLMQRGHRLFQEPLPLDDKGFSQLVMRTQRPIMINEHLAERAAELGATLLGGAEMQGSMIYVPLVLGEEARGLIGISADREHAFTDSDLRLLSTLANSMSVALENARLYEQEKMFHKALQRELEIGREIQSGFLPKTLPQIKGWEIAATLLSAREVAGDFYDVFKLPDRNLGLVIADVCDKGVGAALFMTLFRSLIRAAANLDYFENTKQVAPSRSTCERLYSAISLTNNYIAETHGESGMFATLFFGIIDPRTGKLSYINGGHEPPIIVRGGMVRETLQKTGPAIGVITDFPFDMREVQLDRGDLLLAYTDGVPDCMNPRDEFFGRERLLGILQQDNSSAPKLVKAIENELHEYISGATQFDDITLLAVRHK